MVKAAGRMMSTREALQYARRVMARGWMIDAGAPLALTLPLDGAARTLAAGWASSGTVGAALAALATGADVAPSDVVEDVRATRRTAGALSTLDGLALHYVEAWAADVAGHPRAVVERMIDAGALSPAARGNLASTYADTLDAWADANVLDGLAAAREAATYGAACVLIIRSFYADVDGLAREDCEEIDATPLWLDDVEPADRAATAARYIREHGCTFDATGADWAADPDGSHTDPHTGRVEAVSAHVYGIDAAAVADVVEPWAVR